MKYQTMRKLTPDQVREIRRLRVKGKPAGRKRQPGSIQSLAALFGG